MNVKLLKQIKQKILDEPQKMDMGTWWFDDRRKTDRVPFGSTYNIATGADPDYCGTTGCIAG